MNFPPPSSAGGGGGKERTYFRKTDNKIPDLLLSDYMQAPTIPHHEKGDAPREKKTMNETFIAGDFTTADNRHLITLAPSSHSPRTSVLFSDAPARDVHVPGVDSSDFFSKDTKLGYQVPRLYIGQDRPHTSSHRPSFPSPRGTPTESAKRPRTSDYLVQEVGKIENKFMLEEIRAMTPSKEGWYSLPPDQDWRDKAFPRPESGGGAPIWTPGKGMDDGAVPGAWQTTNFARTQALDRKATEAAKPPTPSLSLLTGTSAPSSPSRHASGTAPLVGGKSSSKKLDKVLYSRTLAGNVGSYESREIQRARESIATSANFAFFPPSPSAAAANAATSTAEPKGSYPLDPTGPPDYLSAIDSTIVATLPLSPSARFRMGSVSPPPLQRMGSSSRTSFAMETEYLDEDNGLGFEPITTAAAYTSASTSRQPSSPARGGPTTTTTTTPMSPYQIGDAIASAPALVNGTFVPRTEYDRLQMSTAQSKRASKRADVASREAKEEYRLRRLNAIVSSRGLSAHQIHDFQAVSDLASKEHRTILKLLNNQESTLERHSHSLQNKIDSSIHLQQSALPLSFLFTVEGGADFCRIRLVEAFNNWIKGFESSQMTVAMAYWKMLVDTQKRKEMQAVYRTQAGSRKLKVILLEIDLRVFRHAFDRWNKRVGYLIYAERDAAVTKIQGQMYRYHAIVRFIALHDAKPIGGPLMDIFMAPRRPGLPFSIYPRVRTERRQFWTASILIQTRYRMIIQRNLFLNFKAAAVLAQSVWQMYVCRREYMRLRYHSIILEAMARAVVKKWQYKRFWKASFVLQRIYRGHLARSRFLVLQKAYRRRIEHRLSMPSRIQRPFRSMRARRVLASRMLAKQERFDAAVRLQCFWYSLQNEFPRFVLLGVLRETDRLDAEFDKDIKKRGKVVNAKKIQRRYREHVDFKQQTASVRIQCMARNAAGSNLVDHLRKERWANRKLRHWVRGTMKRRNKASRRIAFAWYHGKAGRFLQHLVTMNDRAEQRENYERRQQLNFAATVLQAVVHGVWTRRIIVRTRFAIKIEKVVRGFMGRREALRRITQLRHKVVTAFLARMLKEGEMKEIYRVKMLKKYSATFISKVWRGFSLRLRNWRRREVLRTRNEAATTLQRKYRKMLEVKRARIKLLWMARQVSNPFKDEENISELVDASFVVSDEF